MGHFCSFCFQKEFSDHPLIPYVCWTYISFNYMLSPGIGGNFIFNEILNEHFIISCLLRKRLKTALVFEFEIFCYMRTLERKAHLSCRFMTHLFFEHYGLCLGSAFHASQNKWVIISDSDESSDCILRVVATLAQRGHNVNVVFPRGNGIFDSLHYWLYEVSFSLPCSWHLNPHAY